MTKIAFAGFGEVNTPIDIITRKCKWKKRFFLSYLRYQILFQDSLGILIRKEVPSPILLLHSIVQLWALTNA